MERAFYDGTRGFSQSYLLSRIVRNAQRSTKVPFFIREIGVNTLRWPKSFSVILQITGPAPFSATLRSLAQVSPQRLPSCRSLSRSSLCIVTGIGRIENTQALIHNGLIPPLLGLPEFPHRDTLRSFLWRFGPNELHALVAAHDRLRQELFPRLGLRYSAIVDVDTTALITYGSQEGTAVGYIPKRRHGQASYAPIISSEGRSGLSLSMELRAGNVHASSGAWDFLEQVLDKLPSSIAAARTRVRLDGAFYDKKIVQSLDTKRLGYAIVARMYRAIAQFFCRKKRHRAALVCVRQRSRKAVCPGLAPKNPRLQRRRGHCPL